MESRVFVFILYYLAFCLPLAKAVKAAGKSEWWESASLYQIYPRSFQDSDGDGVGDLKGITSRLEYLKEIGVTAAWLSPVFESPMSDFGYDISNFTKIDPLFGTLEDFDEMIAKAKRLNIKILLDFVPNHSSDECEWFKKSVKREAGYEDFYVWHDGKQDPLNSNKRLPPSNWVCDFISFLGLFVYTFQIFFFRFLYLAALNGLGVRNASNFICINSKQNNPI